jgi:hypothetical protein
MSSKYAYCRRTLPFTTNSGIFAARECSPLYMCLVAAGLFDHNKQAALAFLYHLGCLEINKEWGEASFHRDIDSYAVSLSSQFPLVLQLVNLHNNHVPTLKVKARARQAHCPGEKRKSLAPDPPRPFSPLLEFNSTAFDFSASFKVEPPQQDQPLTEAASSPTLEQTKKVIARARLGRCQKKKVGKKRRV